MHSASQTTGSATPKKVSLKITVANFFANIEAVISSAFEPSTIFEK